MMHIPRNIQKEVMRVEDIMRANVRSVHKNVAAAMEELIAAGGKRLRPLFTLLCAGPARRKESTVQNAAAAIEMVHMATLIHDDIIDEAVLRRGRPSQQARFGKDYAVFMGDFLLQRGYRLIHDNPVSPEMLTAMDRVFYGEMLQYEHRYAEDLTVMGYLRIAANKTAALFALACYAGAILGGTGEGDSRRLGRLGYNFGIAFQIRDDILDFVGDEQSLGKDVRNDIKMGFYTLPVIYGARKDPRVWDCIESEDYRQLFDLIRRKGLAETTALADKFAKRAEKLLPLVPDGESREILANTIAEVRRYDR